MRLKRVAAVTLSMMMAFSITAYANDADAVAVYQEMEAKNETLNHVDAYLDYTIDLTDGTNHMDMRLEMNTKANNLMTPEQLQMGSHMRMTLTSFTGADIEVGPGADVSVTDLTGVPITASTYYADGMYYMETLGQKTRTPMPLDQMMSSIEQTTGMTASSLEYMQDMKLRTEGEDRIVSYTMDATKMNELMAQVLGITGMQGMLEGDNASYRDISGECVVNPAGDCIKQRMKMTMDMTVDGKAMSVVMEGDIGYANPGQPVAITVPNLAEYTLQE